MGDVAMSVVGTAKRNRIWKRDGFHCRYCGGPVRHIKTKAIGSSDRATIDHVQPSSRGGNDDDVNLVTCCHACNWRKGNDIWRPKPIGYRGAAAPSIATVTDQLASMESPNMAWLRRVGPIARRLNEEAEMDAAFGEETP
jgi:hypothetical protein